MIEKRGHAYQDYLLDPAALKLYYSARATLVVRYGDREYQDPVVRRAFPLEAADCFIGFFAADGSEIGLLEDPQALDPHSRRLLHQALERTYFCPRILSFERLGEEFGVVQAEVQTDSGPRHLEIRGIRHKVRLLSRQRALIEDVEGNRYELRDYHRLPKLTRKILGL
jgi:hypothetical protein